MIKYCYVTVKGGTPIKSSRNDFYKSESPFQLTYKARNYRDYPEYCDGLDATMTVYTESLEDLNRLDDDEFFAKAWKATGIDINSNNWELIWLN